MKKDFILGLRDQLIISQALLYGVKHLKALEDREEMYPLNGEHAQPSNRQDMEALLHDIFPLYLPLESPS